MSDLEQKLRASERTDIVKWTGIVVVAMLSCGGIAGIINATTGTAFWLVFLWAAAVLMTLINAYALTITFAGTDSSSRLCFCMILFYTPIWFVMSLFYSSFIYPREDKSFPYSIEGLAISLFVLGPIASFIIGIILFFTARCVFPSTRQVHPINVLENV